MIEVGEKDFWALANSHEQLLVTHLKSEILGDSCEQLLEVGEKEFLGGTTMRRTGTIGDNRES